MTNRMRLFSKALCHSGWFLEVPRFTGHYLSVRRKLLLFSKCRKPSQGGGETLLSPPLLLEMKPHSLFSWHWWSVLCLRCQSKTLSSSAQCAKHEKNPGLSRMGFCLGFSLIYACVSFNLSQFCTFSKYWKCFFLSKFIPPQAKLHLPLSQSSCLA